MAAPEIQSFLDNGDLNSESFFLDENQASATPDVSTSICVGGVFSFLIEHAAPFKVTLPAAPSNSRALANFLEKVQKDVKSKSVGEKLTAVTKAYLDIADELDEEQAALEDDDEEDDGAAVDEGDIIDQLNEESLATQSDELRLKMIQMHAEFEARASGFDLGSLSKAMVDRLLADYQKIVEGGTHHGWDAAPKGRDLTKWNLCFKDFDKGSKLFTTMTEWVNKDKEHRKPQIDLLMTFPKEYPFAPPFVRVLRPRISGGLIINGAICTELLTPDGWRPIFEVESIIETIREQVTCDKTHAQIDMSNSNDYTEDEARSGFQTILSAHKGGNWGDHLR